jgi:hypothetical protein
MNNKINLRNTTFIIPVRIESEDRERNLKIILNYLNKNFNTNIIVGEIDKTSVVKYILEELNLIMEVKHLFFKSDEFTFKRNWLLNEMLVQVKTPVVVNYDCDVVLPINSYVESTKMCLEKYDLVYPYSFGDNVQTRVLLNENIIANFLKTNDLNFLKGFPWRAEYGFCQWFNTNSYIKGFMENELFLAYSPDDQERFNRFKILEYNIGRVEGPIFHFEHSRTKNSWINNEHMNYNDNLFNSLKEMTKKQLIDYYSNQEYYKKRLTQI